MSNGQLTTRKVNQRARQALEDGDWGNDIRVKLGAFLLKIMLETVVDDDGEPAFVHSSSQVGTRFGVC